jgi:hypothetical protein
MRPFAMVILHELGSERFKEPSPKRISFDKHSSFAERTQRSANAFRFGLRAGSFTGLMPTCVPQKVHTALTQRLSPANTHGGVRRERQRVELRGLLEYDVDMRSQAVGDAMARGFQVQDSCVASSG